MVTFLFTDIEGSARLWDYHPDAMRKSLARHDEILLGAIRANRGRIFKRLGDGVCAEFEPASDAVTAALTAQRKIRNEPWPDRCELRVRVALLSGLAERREGDYFGPALNRIARLLDAAHGGQILVSSTTVELLGAHMPSGAGVRDLGLHRVKDLQNEERIFQLVHDDLRSDFPPLRSIARFRHNLPTQLTNFVGRSREISEIERLIPACRLLTLTGTGGCGKTRLAVQVASRLGPAFPDGVWMVELATLSDANLLPNAICAALQLREEPTRDPRFTIIDRLRESSLLIVLDNCEHLVSACARVADALLRGTRSLRILATSREALGISGETTWRVPSLRLDGGATAASEPDQIEVSQSEAVQLFISRATSASSTFKVTPANTGRIAEICRRLDGIPLAIELAAARVRALTPGQIALRLDNCFSLLRKGSQVDMPRHQTLRASIDWSFDLLSEDERALFCRLSVFAGGCTMETAEKVCSDAKLPMAGVLDLMAQLIQKSMLNVDESAVERRYCLLETVRQYAREKLDESQETRAITRRLVEFVLAFSEEAENNLRGADQARWLKRLTEEHDNIRTALDYCADSDEFIETGLRIASAAAFGWYMQGRYGEGRARLEQLIASAPAGASRGVIAKALSRAGTLARGQRDYRTAEDHLTRSLDLWRSAGNQKGLADALNNLALLAIDRGQCVAAKALLEESLTIREGMGDRSGIAMCLSNQGMAARFMNDLDLADSLYTRSMGIRREFGDLQGVAISLNNLGDIAKCRGDYEGASQLNAEGLEIFRDIDDKIGIASTLYNLGDSAYHLHDLDEASNYLSESLTLFKEVGDRRGAAAATVGLADVARARSMLDEARQLYSCAVQRCMQAGDRRYLASAISGQAQVFAALGNPEVSACLFGAANALRAACDERLGSMNVDHDRSMAVVRIQLGDSAFDAAYSRGHDMPVEQLMIAAIDPIAHS